MADSSAMNALVVLGLILLVVGGLGFVYGQLQMQDGSGGDGGDGGISISLSGGEGDGDGGAESIPYRQLRLIGVVLGSIGAVVALVGGAGG